MTRVALGDRAASARLYDRITPFVYAAAMQRTGCCELAATRTHHILLEMWRRAAHYAPNQDGTPSELGTRSLR